MYISIQRLRERLRIQYGQLITWEKVAHVYDVDKAVVYRIATSDYEPTDNKIRAQLGLAPICPNCGHIVDIG